MPVWRLREGLVQRAPLLSAAQCSTIHTLACFDFLVPLPFPSLPPCHGASRWGLDRLDQQSLPLDGRFQYYSTGKGINVYILDTVGGVAGGG